MNTPNLVEFAAVNIALAAPIIGAVLAATITAIVTFALQKRKRLEWRKIIQPAGVGPPLDELLGGGADEDGNDLALVANGRHLEMPYCMVVTFRNARNGTIRSRDFEGQPVRIEFEEGEYVRSWVRSGVERLSVKAHLVRPGRIEIEPLMLNGNDAFRLIVLLEGEPKNVKVSARIAEGKVRERRRRKP